VKGRNTSLLKMPATIFAPRSEAFWIWDFQVATCWQMSTNVLLILLMSSWEALCKGRGDRSSFFTARPSAWSVSQAGGAGGLAVRVSAHGFLLTGCRSLVRGIRLVLLRAGNVESNPAPDGGP
jgi:hypothetical protein